MIDLRSAEPALQSALRTIERQARFAEVLAQTSSGRSARISVAGIRAESAPTLGGVAIRAWAGRDWVEAAASDLSTAAIERAVDSVGRTLAKRGSDSPTDPIGDVSGRRETYEGDPVTDEFDLEELVDRVTMYRNWALAVPGVTDGIAYVTASDDARLYLNTVGAVQFQSVPRLGAAVTALCVENGRAGHDWIRLGGTGGGELLDPITEPRVRATAATARALLSARSPPAGPTTVVLDPPTTGVLAHESFGHGTEADQFVRGRSYLQPLAGASVGPPMLSIVDDGAYPGGWGSLHFDDEGTSTRRNLLVDRGRFVGALHDRSTAAALGARPTGNARRSDFLSRVWVRMTNTFVVPGTMSKDEVLAEAGRGVLLEQPTSGMEDPLGGRLQIKVHYGHLIERGEERGLVSSMALSGRVLDVLRNVRAVSAAPGLVMDGLGYCGKGHSDYIPAGSGGPYVATEAIVGPS